MHLALKAYFDGVRAGRPLDEESVIACFLDEFGKAKIDDEVQRDLYTKHGREQLTAFLRSPLGASRQTRCSKPNAASRSKSAEPG